MSENIDILYAMRKKLGHYRQYSAPELNSLQTPENAEHHLLRNTTQNEMFKQQEALMQMSSLNLTSVPGLSGFTAEQLEAFHLRSEGDSESKPRRLFDYSVGCKENKKQYDIHTIQSNYPTDQNSSRSTEAHNVDSSPRRNSLPEGSPKLNPAPKSLDNLTREELIEKLKYVENELAKTKKSPSDSPDLKDDSINQEQFDCLWNGCNKVYSALETLISHIGQEHIGSGKASYKCEWQGCPRNQKPFTKRHKMYNHMRTHTGERPFQCPVSDCGKKFSRPDSLATHVKTHSNIRPYICPIPGCGKAYYHSRSLRKHVKGHEMTRPVHVYSQNFQNNNPQMAYYNSTHFLRPNELNMQHDFKYHHYHPESSFFNPSKPGEDMSSMSNHSAGDTLGGLTLPSNATSGMNSGAGSFTLTNMQIPDMQTPSNIIEPPVLQSHSYSEEGPSRFSTVRNVSSSLTHDMIDTMIVTPSISSQGYSGTTNHPTLSFQTNSGYVNPSDPSTMPMTSQQ